MTLLVTVAGNEYALSCSDMRISVQSGKKYRSVDEKFNKHIVFASGGLKADVSYTGVARWTHKGKIIKLYDIISDSLAKSSVGDMSFGPLCKNLMSDISESLNKKILRNKNGKLIIELHITGYHDQIPYPFIGVISTFRKKAPWQSESELQWKYEYPEMNLYFKVADSPDVIFGGMDTVLREQEKRDILKLVCNGANAYNLSKKIEGLIRLASTRTTSIGPRSVAILMPKNGFLDTNLWAETNTGVVAFMPRMVFPNGVEFGPSEFPVNLNLYLDGYLPKQSLFFKSIITRHCKLSLRRRYFRRKKGDAIPGIMGLLGLSLFGEIADGYSDFGLSSG